VKAGFATRKIALRLSQHSVGNWVEEQPNSCNNIYIQVSSTSLIPMARYSATLDDFETVICFFDDQETIEFFHVCMLNLRISERIYTLEVMDVRGSFEPLTISLNCLDEVFFMYVC
jgi:hypothetical protein